MFETAVVATKTFKTVMCSGRALKTPGQKLARVTPSFYMKLANFRRQSYKFRATMARTQETQDTQAQTQVYDGPVPQACLLNMYIYIIYIDYIYLYLFIYVYLVDHQCFSMFFVNLGDMDLQM